METNYTEGKKFDKTDFTAHVLPKGEYENCSFVGCNFAGANISGIVFVECDFTECDLSTAKLVQTAFREVRFTQCKLLGLHFENCNDFLFAVSFDRCTLNLSSFYKLKIKKTFFKHSALHEVDFTEADLTGSSFQHCDLYHAIFDHTVLEKADLRTAINYTIDPELNRVKKAKFSKEGLPGLLHRFDIEIE